MLKRILPALLGALLLPLAGCGEESLPRGVVAQVNGQPIYLRTLEIMIDTRTAGLGTLEKPSLETLRQRYGTALTSLIVHALVMQELERLGQPITEAVVKEAEDAVRRDYPDGEFEKTLTENAIDPEAWRELLAYRTGMRTFLKKVLFSRLTVPLETIEAYYAANEKNFVVSALLSLCQSISTDRAPLERARTQKTLPEDGDAVRTYCFSLPPASVPPYWKKEVGALKPGEFTPVRVVDGRFELVLLREATPEHKMDIVEAYPYIEQLLLEERVDAAFEDWLEKRLPTAKIRVSRQLLDEVAKRPPVAEQR